MKSKLWGNDDDPVEIEGGSGDDDLTSQQRHLALCFLISLACRFSAGHVSWMYLQFSSGWTGLGG